MQFDSSRMQGLRGISVSSQMRMVGLFTTCFIFFSTDQPLVVPGFHTVCLEICSETGTEQCDHKEAQQPLIQQSFLFAVTVGELFVLLFF